jgi:hypothetical protein
MLGSQQCKSRILYCIYRAKKIVEAAIVSLRLYSGPSFYLDQTRLQAKRHRASGSFLSLELMMSSCMHREYTDRDQMAAPVTQSQLGC